MRRLPFVTSAATIAFVLGPGGNISAGQIEYIWGLSSPEPGVDLDQYGNWCAEGTGVSSSWTAIFMGSKAAHEVRNSHPTNHMLQRCFL